MQSDPLPRSTSGHHRHNYDDDGRDHATTVVQASSPIHTKAGGTRSVSIVTCSPSYGDMRPQRDKERSRVQLQALTAITIPPKECDIADANVLGGRFTSQILQEHKQQKRSTSAAPLSPKSILRNSSNPASPIKPRRALRLQAHRHPAVVYPASNIVSLTRKQRRSSTGTVQASFEIGPSDDDLTDEEERYQGITWASVGGRARTFRSAAHYPVSSTRSKSSPLTRHSSVPGSFLSFTTFNSSATAISAQSPHWPSHFDSNSTLQQLDFSAITPESLRRRRKFAIDDETDDDDVWEYEDTGEARDERQENRRSGSSFKVQLSKARNQLLGPQRYPEGKTLDAHRLSVSSAHSHEAPQVSTEARNISAENGRRKLARRKLGLAASIMRLNVHRVLDPPLGTSDPLARPSAVRRRSFRLPPEAPATSEPKRPKLHARLSTISSVSTVIKSSKKLPRKVLSKAAAQRHSRYNGVISVLKALLQSTREARSDEAIQIQDHVESIIFQQKCLLKLAKALMGYGAPTHQIEECLKSAAKVLNLPAEFVYLPNCMICSFEDRDTHTTELCMVRVTQHLDLGKFRETHKVYKRIVHDKIGVEEGTRLLEEIEKRPNRYSKLFMVFLYGLASASVGPFAFQARWIDLPISFLLGSILGGLQLYVAPWSGLHLNIFEVSAAIVTSFLARVFGSLQGGGLFCFSALAQSSIALILPGYTILCGAMELQSRNIVAGSARMVYAIIFSLVLGFGITIGTAIAGALIPDSTSEVTCENPMSPYMQFVFVPIFTICMVLINHGKWVQVPSSVILSFTGYVVNHFSLRRLGNGQVANALGALTIGFLGNIYSRVFHGLSAAALIPAIFVQVPSGLAASGCLTSGIINANRITNVSGPGSNMMMGNTTVMGGIQVNNNEIFEVGYSMIQIAIGITVGLFLSNVLVYPKGKKRSGLFSF
ncbi:hypothetical protein MMC25_008303 [Agyrium rufum]|nr:hypothetical protein [Agyrium rufum]